ncbi:hypothetical protein [Polaribacter sp. Hel1_85]|uniref:hypothetical protein n=1 Tax=Polaribacter sp. Hel1_85 TaxID=1250005 RepID=UPI00052D7D9C|nr:hypothetical protein [Polaribacter sp. Hel1_85]KGL63570.1 hypothetical protein PHEL85_0607 [Polaribacter sp. Hel1_85]
MKKYSAFFFLPIFILVLSCKSELEEDCIKTIIVQHEFIISSSTGTTTIPEITQVVDCSFPEPDAPKSIEELQKLTDFSYDVIEFNFTPDTGNNTNKLEYKIQLNNLSNKAVKGIPYITINIDGLVSTEVNFGACRELEANSNCIISLSKEASLDLGIIENISFVKVEFFITK